MQYMIYFKKILPLSGIVLICTFVGGLIGYFSTNKLIEAHAIERVVQQALVAPRILETIEYLKQGDSENALRTQNRLLNSVNQTILFEKSYYNIDHRIKQIADKTLNNIEMHKSKYPKDFITDKP